MSMYDIAQARLTEAAATRSAKFDELNAIPAAALTEARSLTPDEDTRAAELLAEVEALDVTLAELTATVARYKAAEEAAERAKDIPTFIRKPDAIDPTADNVRRLNQSEARSAALKIVEEARWLDPARAASVQRAIDKRTADYDGDLTARRLLLTETPAYRSAFLKGITGRSDEMTDTERRSLSEVRAMSLTTTAGGFGVPVLIDPTVLVTDGTGLTGILPYCDVETINTNAWKGVSAGHTTWSFDAEAAEVSDDASTFAQPSVTAHMARGFIPFSIEIEQDYPGFASQMATLLSEGYVDLLAEKLAVGTGTAEPWGIFITTTTTVDVTTDNTFGAADIDKVWAALGETFRSRATWFMNVDVENDIRGFGSGTATSRFTVDQTREGISLLNGRPVVLSDWAPTWTGTDAASILVLGDFSKFKVVQRAGMTIEYVPHLTSTGSNRPNGTRGWFAHARVGSDKSVQNAFRKLKNITT